MTTAPTMATRIRTDVTSKANAWVVKMARPMRGTELMLVTADGYDEK